MKFKKGDLVVVTCMKDMFMNSEYLNATGTIIGRGTGGYDYEVLFVDGADHFFEEELELSEIVNSPLWKALS